jgi:hypothetical protein
VQGLMRMCAAAVRVLPVPGADMRMALPHFASRSASIAAITTWLGQRSSSARGRGAASMRLMRVFTHVLRRAAASAYRRAARCCTASMGRAAVATPPLAGPAEDESSLSSGEEASPAKNPSSRCGLAMAVGRDACRSDSAQCTTTQRALGGLGRWLGWAQCQRGLCTRFFMHRATQGGSWWGRGIGCCQGGVRVGVVVVSRKHMQC